MNADRSMVAIRADELFAAISVSMPIGLFLADRNGHFTSTNENFQSLIGCTFSESLGSGWQRHIHQDERDRVSTSFAATAHDGEPFSAIIRFSTPNHLDQRIDLRSAPIRTSDNQCGGHIGTAEVALLEPKREGGINQPRSNDSNISTAAWAALARYGGLFEYAADAIVVANREGELLEANRAAIKLLGYSKSEIRHLTVADIVASDPMWTNIEYDRFLTEGEWHGELDIRAEDGTTQEMDIRATAIALPTDNIYIATMRNLSELRRLERGRQRLMRGFASASLRIAASESLEEVLEAIVEEARHVIGAHKAVVSIGANTKWPDLIIKASLSDDYAAWRDFDGKPTNDGIYRLVRKNNRTFRMTQQELESHPAWNRFGDSAGNHPPMRGWLATPLLDREGTYIGQIQLSDKELGEFDESDEAVLVQLSQLASTALENHRLYYEAQHAIHDRDEALRLLEQRVAALAQVAAGLTFDHPLDTALQALASNVVKASHAAAALVGLRSDGPGAFRIAGAANLPKGFRNSLETAVADGGGGMDGERNARAKALDNERSAGGIPI